LRDRQIPISNAQNEIGETAAQPLGSSAEMKANTILERKKYNGKIIGTVAEIVS